MAQQIEQAQNFMGDKSGDAREVVYNKGDQGYDQAKQFAEKKDQQVKQFKQKKISAAKNFMEHKFEEVKNRIIQMN